MLVKAGTGIGFSFVVRSWTEMEIKCVKGMHMLNIVTYHFKV